MVHSQVKKRVENVSLQGESGVQMLGNKYRSYRARRKEIHTEQTVKDSCKGGEGVMGGQRSGAYSLPSHPKQG